MRCVVVSKVLGAREELYSLTEPLIRNKIKHKIIKVPNGYVLTRDPMKGDHDEIIFDIDLETWDGTTSVSRRKLVSGVMSQGSRQRNVIEGEEHA